MLFQPARYMGLKPAGAQNAFGYPKLSMNFCPRQATSAGAKVVLRRVALKSNVKHHLPLRQRRRNIRPAGLNGRQYSGYETNAQGAGQ